MKGVWTEKGSLPSLLATLTWPRSGNGTHMGSAWDSKEAGTVGCGAAEELVQWDVGFKTLS